MNDIIASNLEAIRKFERSDQMNHLMSKATSMISMSKSLEEYGLLVKIIDFERIEKMLIFMSSRDLKNSYVRSEQFRTLLATMPKHAALKEISAIARRETFATSDLQNDQMLTLGRCSNKNDLIRIAADYLLHAMNKNVRSNSDQNLMQMKIDGKIETISTYRQSTLAEFVSIMLSNVLSHYDALKIVKQIEDSLNSSSWR